MKKQESNKQFYSRNAVMLILMMMFIILDMIFGHIVLKGLASLCFVATGTLNYFSAKPENKRFALLLLFGLICGMFGDIGILVNFQIGAGCFAIGHILYVLSFCKLKPPCVKDILPIMIFLAVAIVCVLLVLPDDTSMLMRILCFVYAGIISTMTGKAVSLKITLRNKLTLILCIGSVAFFISDIMVLLAEFSLENQHLFTCICHCIYYPGQFILAQALSSRSSSVYVNGN